MADTGENAPDFTLPRDGGGTVSLAELKGAPVVLYFYPRDDTPGCTTEAVEFTGLGEDFKAAGAQVIGVSKDTVAKHDKFIAKHDLGVILASDAEGDVCERYGVWVEKNMYGKKSMGIERATFLIDAEGRIAKVWRKVKAKGHAAEVLDAVRAG
ncbi:MAG: peroxiredoxin [Rhodobacteraceae bacterium]|nr:peroxiredoxin [Paracoccaceae bacterium]TVR48280.1 MAG: peroxiredoxin [Paracoccaceae bacterium]